MIALGKCGSREMTARSDLDLMTLYRPESPIAASEIKAWSAETFSVSPGDQMHGNFSPDGRFLAYTSNEAGSFQVYVQTFPLSN